MYIASAKQCKLPLARGDEIDVGVPKSEGLARDEQLMEQVVEPGNLLCALHRVQETGG